MLPTSPTTIKSLHTLQSPRSLRTSPIRHLNFASGLVAGGNPTNPNSDSMYQPSLSPHSYIVPKHHHHTQIMTNPQVPTNFKLEPCWKHLLDMDTHTLQLHHCAWLDILCPGQHPKESREYINEIRSTHNLPEVDPEVLIFSELNEREQHDVCVEQMRQLSWNTTGLNRKNNASMNNKNRDKYQMTRIKAMHAMTASSSTKHKSNNAHRIHHHVHHSNEEVYRLQHEIETLKMQLTIKLDLFRNKYSKDANKQNVELLTRNAILETELAHYKVYMTTSVARFKREKKKMGKIIRRLEMELVHQES
jgi:hypothetical protein